VIPVLRVAYGYTGRDMHALPATDNQPAPTALCGRLAIPGTDDYRTALTTGPKCPTCRHRSIR
jgi:hypothetical protein